MPVNQMTRAIQLNVVLPNIPSSLAKLSDALRAASVNIEGIFCSEGQDRTTVHLIVDDTETAKMVMHSFGNVTETPVFELKLKNQPGAIASVARKCAGANINVRYIYVTTHGKDAVGYISVDDMEKAEKLLK